MKGVIIWEENHVLCLLLDVALHSDDDTCQNISIFVLKLNLKIKYMCDTTFQGTIQ